MPHKDPKVRKVYRKANYEANKEKRKQQMKKYRETLQAKTLIRNHHMNYYYGISLERYKQMLQEQNGVCKICKSDNPGKRRTNFCIDHNHTTGEVRGLLCSHCNLILGMVRDDKSIINALIVYLKEYENG